MMTSNARRRQQPSINFTVLTTRLLQQLSARCLVPVILLLLLLSDTLVVDCSVIVNRTSRASSFSSSAADTKLTTPQKPKLDNLDNVDAAHQLQLQAARRLPDRCRPILQAQLAVLRRQLQASPQLLTNFYARSPQHEAAIASMEFNKLDNNRQQHTSNAFFDFAAAAILQHQQVSTSQKGRAKTADKRAAVALKTAANKFIDQGATKSTFVELKAGLMRLLEHCAQPPPSPSNNDDDFFADFLFASPPADGAGMGATRPVAPTYYYDLSCWNKLIELFAVTLLKASRPASLGTSCTVDAACHAQTPDTQCSRAASAARQQVPFQCTCKTGFVEITAFNKCLPMAAKIGWPCLFTAQCTAHITNAYCDAESLLCRCKHNYQSALFGSACLQALSAQEELLEVGGGNVHLPNSTNGFTAITSVLKAVSNFAKTFTNILLTASKGTQQEQEEKHSSSEADNLMADISAVVAASDDNAAALAQLTAALQQQLQVLSHSQQQLPGTQATTTIKPPDTTTTLPVTTPPTNTSTTTPDDDVDRQLETHQPITSSSSTAKLMETIMPAATTAGITSSTTTAQSSPATLPPMASTSSADAHEPSVPTTPSSTPTASSMTPGSTVPTGTAAVGVRFSTTSSTPTTTTEAPTTATNPIIIPTAPAAPATPASITTSSPLPPPPDSTTVQQTTTAETTSAATTVSLPSTTTTTITPTTTTTTPAPGADSAAPLASAGNPTTTSGDSPTASTTPSVTTTTGGTTTNLPSSPPVIPAVTARSGADNVVVEQPSDSTPTTTTAASSTTTAGQTTTLPADNQNNNIPIPVQVANSNNILPSGGDTNAQEEQTDPNMVHIPDNTAVAAVRTSTIGVVIVPPQTTPAPPVR